MQDVGEDFEAFDQPWAGAGEVRGGVDPWRSGLGPIILINLAFPFFAPGLNISIGGHVGGLIGGGIAAFAMDRLTAQRRGELLPILACVAVAAISIAGALAVASSKAAELGV